MTRFLNRSMLACALLMSAVGAEGADTSGAPAAADGVATETGAAAEARKRAAASNFLPIVRGRLPLPFVHAIRFDKVLNAMSNKDLASKFATSVGKVFDIKKGRNFGYVNEGFKPTAEDVAAAQGWIDQVGAENAKGQKAIGDQKLMQTTLDGYKEAGLATPEQAAAFAAARTSTRVKVDKPATGGATLPGAAEDTKTTATAGTADDLLS